MQQSSGGAPIGAPVTTGTVTRNRFVDMHVFEIDGAQAGEEFVFMVRGQGGGSAGVAGFAFDVVVPEPATAGMALAMTATVLAVGRRRR